MAEQGRSRQSHGQTSQREDRPLQDKLEHEALYGHQQPIPEDDKLRKTPLSTEPQFIEKLHPEDDPIDEPKEQPVDTVKVMQTVFTAMKKHFDNAKKEALSLPNSDEMAAMLAHLNMAELAMDVMISHAEGSLV